MNPDDLTNSVPLTPDEGARLVAFLAERGHVDAARQIAHATAMTILTSGAAEAR